MGNKIANIIKSLKEHKDQIPGGKADKRKPEDFDQKELALGIKVEMEHTTDKNKAQEIAMDHLSEIKDYYTRLNAMEENAKKKLKNQ